MIRVWECLRAMCVYDHSVTLVWECVRATCVYDHSVIDCKSSVSVSSCDPECVMNAKVFISVSILVLNNLTLVPLLWILKGPKCSAKKS